ncbi:MAG TPA: hypothetical protein VG754_09490 [Verrucomicrobiae bacterium]|nr:hypothetical protein [Verrucomicrobiae bacterium]
MKRFFTVILACLLAGVVFLVFIRTQHVSPPSPEENLDQQSSSNQAASPAGNAASTIPADSSSAGTGTANPSSPNASSATQPENLSARAGERVDETNEGVNLPPDIVLQNVRRAVRQYGAMFGGNPVGTNPEITAALTGKNPKQINFLNGQPGMRINQDGELLDAWGTPYFFHQISGTEMEIHSAGPDKIMWTSDDLVTR